MKELSIEQKAKAYDEAIERARKLHENSNGMILKKWLWNIFPELKESEDKRIRKKLIDLTYKVYANTSYITCVEHDEMLAWLEKQGEQKPTIIIPKFRVGDEIKTSNEESLTITKIDEKGYWSEDLFICGFDDADKWELVEQKPAWSEEDERNLQGVIDEIQANKNNAPDYDIATYDRFISWLKSLKPQNRWKPSDEQMTALRRMKAAIAGEGEIYKPLNSLYEDLKKLKG